MNLLKEAEGAALIGISGHIRPDGDCVGSCLALYQYLSKALPEAEVHVYLEQPSGVFSFIKGYDSIETGCSEEKVFDVFFALDSNKERLGAAEKYFDGAKKTINIDHHISNAKGCGNVNVIDPEISSASELLYTLLEEELVDEHIAKALYLGMVHDTGVFQYSNTSPETLRRAAKLIAYGFDFSALIEETFYEKSYVQNHILGRALLESFLLMDGQCIVSSLDKKTMDFYGATSKDLEGIVSQLRVTAGVECAIFMYQTDTLEYKVSMRSKGKVDVAKVASYFGGGGHVRAAGCTMNGTVHDVINNLSLHIEKQLKGK